MRLFILPIFCLIAFVSFCCKTPKPHSSVQKDISTQKIAQFDCDYCNKIINNSALFSYPKRYVIDEIFSFQESVDEKTNKIRRGTVSTLRVRDFVPDSLRVYTFKEFEQMNKLKYCFIGKTRKEISHIIDSKEEFSMKNTLYFDFNIATTTDFGCAENCQYTINQNRILAFEAFAESSESAVFLGDKNQQLLHKKCIEN